MQFWRKFFWPVSVLVATAGVFLASVSVRARGNAAPNAIAVGEGRDFFTWELRTPRDMDAFSDVSQGINHAGANNEILNMTFDGVFSGTAEGSYSEFYVLYPGYQPGLLLPGTGVVTPVESGVYKCFYMAMKVDISSTTTEYFWNTGWVEDRTLDAGNGAWGKTFGNKVVNNQWVLYQIENLSTWPHIDGDGWNTLGQWQGFRVTPILNRPNTNFHVDWVRLTDCQPVNVTLTSLSAGETYAIEIQRASLHKIRVEESVVADNSGKILWDVQGIEPGTYTYFVKRKSDDVQVQQGTLTIEPAPIPTFTNPSPFSGEEYSAGAGNPWDMQASNDVAAVYCMTWNFVNGIFAMDTQPPANLPSECVGGGANEADPIVYLNTPLSEDISAYRYLSLRHKIDGAWPQPAQGMIIRWIWQVVHPTKPGEVCEYVSREIALDIGWHTYWVDLHDPYNGTPIEVGGSSGGVATCPANVKWSDQHSPLTFFRLDPNENVTSGVFHQEIDWIALTKVEAVEQGVQFPIQVSMNKSPAEIQAITFYYTDDLEQPTQNLIQGSAFQTAAPSQASPLAQPEGSNFIIYLPLVTNKFMGPPPPVENEILQYWDTSQVTPGTYYICATSNDGHNQTTLCSDAPIQVLP